MKPIVLVLSLAAIAAVANSQTPAKTAAGTSVRKATPAAATAAAAKPAASAATAKTASASAPWIKLPPGVPRVAHEPVKVPFAMHYEDIKVGAGPEAETGKLWHIKYAGWRASDGVKFDSWDDHKTPVVGKDGKPELGADGKPKMADPEPMVFPQGQGRVIPGFDYGLMGMRIGGKRRLFIPWQMAYGFRSVAERPDHPGIPAKADLIFDVELVEVTDMPRPVMPASRPAQQAPAHPAASAQPGTVTAAPATAQPAAPAQPATPAQPQTQPK
jgi:peptidylprolyl isomerase